MPQLNFRLAQPDDLEPIFSIFENAISVMYNSGIHQWDEVYPNMETLEEDISKQQLYMVISEENILAAYVLNQEFDQGYSLVNWKYSDSSFCVVHRLCVDPKFQNQEIATMTMKYIEEHAKNSGVESIRLDAFILNPFAVKLYEKLGYENVGTVMFRKGEFYLFEKKLFKQI